MFGGARGGWVLMMINRKKRQISKQQRGKRRVLGSRSTLPGKSRGDEPHLEINGCLSLSICLSPSPFFFANLFSILISGMYKHRHNASSTSPFYK